MQINNTKNNIHSKAKLSPYPNTITNKKILYKFEEKTKSYPNLTLIQDSISFTDKDFFLLMDGSKLKSFKTASYTNNRAEYSTVDKIVDRFVEIFNEMVKQK